MMVKVFVFSIRLAANPQKEIDFPSRGMKLCGGIRRCSIQLQAQNKTKIKDARQSVDEAVRIE